MRERKKKIREVGEETVDEQTDAAPEAEAEGTPPADVTANDEAAGGDSADSDSADSDSADSDSADSDSADSDSADSDSADSESEESAPDDSETGRDDQAPDQATDEGEEILEDDAEGDEPTDDAADEAPEVAEEPIDDPEDNTEESAGPGDVDEPDDLTDQPEDEAPADPADVPEDRAEDGDVVEPAEEPSGADESAEPGDVPEDRAEDDDVVEPAEEPSGADESAEPGGVPEDRAEDDDVVEPAEEPSGADESAEPGDEPDQSDDTAAAVALAEPESTETESMEPEGSEDADDPAEPEGPAEVEEAEATGDKDDADDAGGRDKPDKPDEPLEPEDEPAPLVGRARLFDALAHFRRGQAAVAVLLCVLGYAAVVQVQTNTDDSTYAGLREQELIDILSGLAGTTQKAQEQIEDLEATRDELEDQTLQQQTALQRAEEQVDTLKVIAGTVPVSGPGITIEIDPGADPLRLTALLDLIEELRTSGAEAMEIEGADGEAVRLVASSSIEVSQPTPGLNVGSELIGPPYRLQVIGPPDTLAGAIDFYQGPQDQLEEQGADVKVESEEKIDIESIHTVSR